jgi:hypothetical protein
MHATDTKPPVADRLAEASPGVDQLLGTSLGWLLRVPDRRGTQSAWWGHVPFAAWLIAAARPATLVELGTHAGVSYAAFCQAVLAEALDTRCHAVDTWQGDAHAGRYESAVWEEFSRFHAARYAGFSTLHRCRFDDALAEFADGTVDILHIDGFHSYEAVRHDFETWLPKLSPRAVVLLHDIAERQAGFGVWQFWEEVSARYPSFAFAFAHSHGLGILAVGAEAPAPVRQLCDLSDPADIATTRQLFATIGGGWMAEPEIARLSAIEGSLTWQAAWRIRRRVSSVPGLVPLLRAAASLLRLRRPRRAAA